MSKRKRRRKHPPNYRRRPITVPCAEIVLAERDGKRYVRTLVLPPTAGQWLWERSRDDSPAWQELRVFSARSDVEKAVPTHHDVTDDDGDEEIDEVEIADDLRTLVGRTIELRDTEVARGVDDALSAVSDPEFAGMATSMMWALLTGWLVGARDVLSAIEVVRALDWVKDSLGRAAFVECMKLAGLLGHPLALGETTGAEVFDRLETDPLSPLVWMVAGVVATAANGEVAWLRQFDLPYGD